MGSDQKLYLLADSTLDRRAYSALLAAEFTLSPHVESDFSHNGVWAALQTQPDSCLVLADRVTIEIREALQMIVRLHKSIRILVAGSSLDPAVLQGWSDIPLAGYLYKDADMGEFRRAMEALREGRSWFSEGSQALIEEGRNSSNRLQTLSRRESELLPLLAQGLTLREAAERMTVSYKTADSYRTSLLRKLGLRDRVGLTRYAIRERIVDL